METKTVVLLILALIGVVFIFNFVNNMDLGEQATYSIPIPTLSTCEAVRLTWIDGGYPCVKECVVLTQEHVNCMINNCGYYSDVGEIWISADPNNACSVFVDSDCKTQCIYETSTTCTPDWQCTGWTACSGGIQTRICSDLNNCGVTTAKPAETQTCIIGGDAFVCDSNADGLINRDELGVTIQQWINN